MKKIFLGLLLFFIIPSISFSEEIENSYKEFVIKAKDKGDNYFSMAQSTAFPKDGVFASSKINQNDAANLAFTYCSDKYNKQIYNYNRDGRCIVTWVGFNRIKNIDVEAKKIEEDKKQKSIENQKKEGISAQVRTQISTQDYERVLDPVEGEWRVAEGAMVTTLKIKQSSAEEFIVIMERSDKPNEKLPFPIKKAAGGLYYSLPTKNNQGRLGNIEIGLININKLLFKGAFEDINKRTQIIPNIYFSRTFPINFAEHNSKYQKNSPHNKDTAKGTAAIYSGTAFFINNEGYLITNHHVIKECNNKSKISHEKRDIDAILVASDPTLDLALLKAEIKNKNYIKISTKSPEKLQRIIVVGYPLGKRLSDDLKVTSGIISALKGGLDNSNQIQIDATLNHGNSGGPIVDEKTGELVAVAVSGIKKEVANNVNFGIKSESVLSFLKSNKIKEQTNLYLFSSGSNNVLKRLEESVVYTYCRV